MGFPGKNSEAGSYFLPQVIFLTQGSNLDLLNCRQILYRLSHWGNPHTCITEYYSLMRKKETIPFVTTWTYFEDIMLSEVRETHKLCDITYTWVKATVFPVVMYGCESWTIKESWVLKNWYFWTVVLEKILESPLDCKEIQPVHPKENQSWIFIARTDVEAETPIHWPPDAKNWLIRKDLGAGKDWRQEEKGMTEDEMVGWHHWLDGHEFEQALGVRDRQGILACCSPWGHKESHTTEWPNWTDWPLSHKKNENLLFAATWMDLEGIMLFSELSQTEKDKYYMISLIGGI